MKYLSAVVDLLGRLWPARRARRLEGEKYLSAVVDLLGRGNAVATAGETAKRNTSLPSSTSLVG